MDYGLLVIFLCAGSWLYACLLLALSDARWNRGRIIQCAICAAFGGSLVITKQTGIEQAVIVALLAFVTFVLPLILRRKIAELLSQRKFARAKFTNRILSALLWRSTADFSVAERLCSAASSPWLAAPGNSRWLERLVISPSRKAFLEGQITTLTAIREYAPALKIFEEEFGPGGLTPDAGLLYTIAVAYAEAGNLPKAAHYLRSAEEMRHAPSALDVRRFIAALHVYAHAGRVYAVERLLANNPAAVAALPPAYARLWRGLALLKHGEPEVAREVLAGAIAKQHSGEEWLLITAQHYLDLTRIPQPPTDFNLALAADLDAIEALEEHPLSSGLPGKTGWHPYVTWGLMAVCAAVFVVMNLSGGTSEDPYILARFGANASQMVKLGDWWRLVTSIFIHVDPLHLFFNLYAFYLFGPFIERLVGRWEAFVIFMFSGIAGAAASTWLGSHYSVSAGASGAIFGMIGAATVIGVTFKTIPKNVRRVYLMNFLFIASINFLYGLFEPHIDNFAHGGGLAAGVLVGLFLSPSEAPDRKKIAFRFAGVLLGMIMVAGALSATKNAVANAYPRRIPASWRHVTSGEGWSLEVPSFWGSDTTDKQHERFDDGLGSVLAVSSRQGLVRLTSGAGEDLKSLTYEKIGNYQYEKIVTTAVVDSERLANFGYVTFHQGRSYILEFACPEKYLDQFGPIVDKLVAGFEIQQSKRQPEILRGSGVLALLRRRSAN